MSDDKVPYEMTITCVPEKGWVTVQAEAVVHLENPIIELSILSEERQTLATTLVMDAPSSFRITLHPRGVELDMPMFLQVKKINAEDSSVETIGEYPFVFGLSPTA